jgi:transposase-like protein
MEDNQKRRKQYSIFEKQLILRQHYRDRVPLATLARQYNVSRFAIHKWKDWVNIDKDPVMPHGKVEQMLAELEKLRQENQVLKKSVEELTYEKTCHKILIDELKKTFQAKSSLPSRPKSSKKKRSR